MQKSTGLDPRFCKDDDFPVWGYPCRMGYFSVNSDRLYEPGHAKVRYYKHPRSEIFPLDLNDGIETAKRKPGCRLDEGIDRLLRFIVDNYSELIHRFDKLIGDTPPGRTQIPLLPVEFVSWRSLLRLIMNTPYSNQKWIIRVTRYRGTFYLSQVETDEAKNDRLSQSEIHRCMCSWGLKFEQYCLSKSPEEDPKTNEPVDEDSEFSCVFFTKLARKHKMLFAAEIDGIRSDRAVHFESKLPLDHVELLELKTCLKDMNERQVHSYFSHKIRDWWCQAFLVDVREIVVGWRDDDGFVHSIEHIPIKDLPPQAKNWSPSKCAWSLCAFFDCLKSLMAKVDCPHTVWELKYHASNSPITYEVYENPSEKSFLSEEYIEFIDNLSKPTRVVG